MVATATRREAAILLKYDDGAVMVETRDEDRFVISARKAVEACLDLQRQDEVIRSFKEQFIRPLHDWCEKHAGRLSACYTVPADKHIEVFVVGATDRYDFDLGREIAALEATLFDSGWRVTATQLPSSDLSEQEIHFTLGEAIEVYALGN